MARSLGTLAVQMQTVAVGWQVYSVRENPLDLGLIGLAEFLPLLLLAYRAQPLLAVGREHIDALEDDQLLGPLAGQAMFLQDLHSQEIVLIPALDRNFPGWPFRVACHRGAICIDAVVIQ